MTASGDSSAANPNPHSDEVGILLPDGTYGREEAQNAGLITQVPPAHLPRFQDLIDRLKRDVPRALAEPPQAYDNVAACFVSWVDVDEKGSSSVGGGDHANDTDAAGAATSAGADPRSPQQQLIDLLRNDYRYDVRDVRLPSTQFASAVFTKEVLQIVSGINRPAKPSGRTTGRSSLFILYYGGLSGYRRKDKRGIWLDRVAPSYASVEWEEVASCVQLAGCDVLFIFDCGFSSAIVQRHGGAWSRRCEVLASAGADHSFTIALVSLLRSSIGEVKTAMQLSWRLSSEEVCKKFGLAAPPQWSSLTGSNAPGSSILLQPMGAAKPSMLGSRVSPLRVVDKPENATEVHVLVGVRFANAAEAPVLEEYVKWVASTVQSTKRRPDMDLELPEKLRKSLKCHTLFNTGGSVFGIISIPVWLWNCLGPSPAWSFIVHVRDDTNLFQPGRQQQAQIEQMPSERPLPPKYTNVVRDPGRSFQSSRSNPPKVGLAPRATTASFRRIEADLQQQFTLILSDARKKYSESTGLELKDFAQPSLRTVEDLIKQVDSEHNRFTDFRDKRKPLFEAMTAACKPLEVIGEAIAGTASEAFPPAQNIFAAVIYLINAGKGVSECYDSITELFGQLKDFTVRLKFYVSERISAELHEKVVQILATVFEILVVATNEVKKGRVKSYFKRLMGKESPVAEAMKNLEALTEGEERLVIAETNAVVKRSLSNQQRLLEMMTRLDVNQQTIRTEARQPQTKEQVLSSNRSKLKGILRPSLYAEDTYGALTRTRTPGTGDWILNDPLLQAWVRGDFRFLWISGNPGTGKSYLASRVVTWGKELLVQPDTSDMMGYFFFRQNNPETRSVVQALRDMAFQVSEQDVFFGKQLIREVSSSEELKTVSSAFRKLFVEPCAPDKWRRHIYIVMDGLDEADPREMSEFLALLDDLNRQPAEGTRVQIAMVGRTSITDVVLEPLRGDSTGGEQVRSLHITPERNSADITSYIVEGVNRAKILSRESQEFRDEVIAVMTKQVDGLFVLANFMLGQLRGIRNARRIIPSLQSYPTEINGMLRKAVLDFSAVLDQEEADDLNEMLQWIAVAQMGLTLEQIEAVLTLKAGDAPWRLEEMLRGQFSCFFTLQRADGMSTANLESESGGAGVNTDFASNKRTTYVTFSHQSVRDFFLGEGSSPLSAGDDKPPIGFRQQDARLHILKTCLHIFTDPEFLPRGEETLSLQRYAAWYWQEHLQGVEPEDLPSEEKAELGRQLYSMLNEELVVLTWTNLFEESLDIWTDDNLESVQQWLADEDITSGLSLEGQSWALAASRSTARLLRPLGAIYADAWLKEDFVMYMPTLFCFGVVQCVALLEDEGSRWSDSEHHWLEVAVETRVQKAAEWAWGLKHVIKSRGKSAADGKETAEMTEEEKKKEEGVEEKDEAKTGYWYRRIGSTLLNLGLQTQALSYFEKALATDGDVVENCGRMGLCHAMNGDWDKALRLHLMCEAKEMENAAKGLYKTQREVTVSRWRLYKNLAQIAECHNRLGHVEQALAYGRRAIDHAFDNPAYEPEAAYVRILAQNGRVAELMTWFRELDASNPASAGVGAGAADGIRHEADGGLQRRQEKNGEHPHSRFIDFILTQIPDPVVRIWFPEAAARTGETELLADTYATAAEVARRELQDPWRALYLTNSLGRAHLCACRYDDAFRVYRRICFEDYTTRGSLAVRTEYVASFKHLARAYAAKAVMAASAAVAVAGGGGAPLLRTGEGEGEGEGEDSGGLTAAAAEAIEPWVRQLEELQAQQDRHRAAEDAQTLRLAGLDSNEASLFLILLYRLRGDPQGLAVARELAAARVAESLALLEDDEPGNDEISIRNLQRTLVAIGDYTNATALFQSTREPVSSTGGGGGGGGGRHGKKKKGRGGGATPTPTHTPAVGRLTTTTTGTTIPHTHRRGSSGGSPNSSSPSPSPRRRGRDVELSGVFSNLSSDPDSVGGGGWGWGAGAGHSLLACDYCLRRLAPAEEMLVCKLCVDLRFCGGCVSRFGAAAAGGVSGGGGGGFTPGHGCACGPGHDWLAVPPLERELGAGQILVGQRIVGLDQWKAEVRLRWVLGRKGSGAGSENEFFAGGGGGGMGGLGITIG